MDDHLPPDILVLDDGFAAVERNARDLIEGLSELEAVWRASPAAWSITECLDHLAIANRVYLDAMRPAASDALARGRHRRGPAVPGMIGGWFVRSLEPPVRRKTKAPSRIRPRTAPPLSDVVSAFFESHAEVQRFLRTYASIDLAGVRFPNPFIRGVRFSLATGLHVLAAHERRHLWQAWRAREAAARSLQLGRAS